MFFLPTTCKLVLTYQKQENKETFSLEDTKMNYDTTNESVEFVF